MKRFLIYLGISFGIAFLTNITINYDYYYLPQMINKNYGKALGNLLFSPKAFMIYITITCICTLILFGIERAIYNATNKEE